MSHLVDRIIETLQSACPAAELDKAIRNAAFYFEKWRNLPAFGWPDEVNEASVDESNVARLKSALVGFIRRGGHGCWALGKSADPALKPVYIEVLNRELNGDANELYQAMIILDDLGEPVFGGRTSLSILEAEGNRASAKEYLQSLSPDT